MGSWMSVLGTEANSTVLATTEFQDFNVQVITLTHLTFRVNAAVDCRTFLRVTRSIIAS